jgi:hypothetical protein
VLLLTRVGLSEPALIGVPRIEAGLDDLETLKLKLDLFIQGVTGAVPRGGIQTPMEGTRADEHPPETSTGVDLEARVAKLIRSSLSHAVTEVDRSRFPDRPDFALYFAGPNGIPELVFLQVKRVRGDVWRRRIREAISQLSTQVVRANASLGVVVYDGAPQDSKLPTRPPVVTFSLKQLETELEDKRLDQLLWQARNEMVHGR